MEGGSVKERTREREREQEREREIERGREREKGREGDVRVSWHWELYLRKRGRNIADPTY